MTVLSMQRIVSVLLDSGLVSSSKLDEVEIESRNTGKKKLRLIVEKGLLNEEKLLNILERELQIPQVNLNQIRIEGGTASSVPPEIAHRHNVIPIDKQNKRLTLAMSDPFDLEAIDEVSMITGCEVDPVLARESAIKHLIAHHYGFRDYDDLDEPADNGNISSEQSPVVRMVNSLIEKAIEEGASDIHLEPNRETLRIRMRLDGILHDLSSPPKQAQANIISRVKIMSGLDIAEKRLPQDGNIDWKGEKEGINLRISTLPTIYGEKVVIRLLEKEKIVLPLENLGFAPENFRVLMRLLLNQHGLLLVTGPTGCGKTTTLYSALNYLNRPEDNIVTVEDPVEYRLDRINQVQVNRRINRTFAGSLRSILRQDPNIIMVGEIRDLETAKITTQAALTGHLVLSTLHTNNAAGAVTRLIDMGLEDYLVTASLLGVIAQRLVRKICSECREEYRLSDQEKIFYNRFFRKDPPPSLIRGGKCRSCNNTGYRNRTSIQEILVLDQELQDLILKGATAEILHRKALEKGMKSLVDDGQRAVESGITTVPEIIRSTFSSIFDSRISGSEESLIYLAKLYHDLQKD